ncbi:MAG: SCP2 sterol-binding domain-containing protein [Oscillospiraceae bacterium]|nr:SCP2 sterol-binding domain-containing protein [Oscillospiraceae bacterium]
MTYEKFFADVKKAYSKADKRKLDEDFAFQFNITGEGEGIFYVAYRGGILEVAPYDYVDRNAILYAPGENFVKLANGKFTLEDAISSEFIYLDGDYNLALVLNKLALATTDKKDSSGKAKKPKQDTTVKAKKPEAPKTEVKKAEVKKPEVKKTGTVRKAPTPSVPDGKRDISVSPTAAATATVDSSLSAKNAVSALKNVPTDEELV